MSGKFNLLDSDFSNRSMPVSLEDCEIDFFSDNEDQKKVIVSASQRRLFDRLPASLRKQILSEYGTATNAFSSGLFIVGKKAFIYKGGL